MIADNFKSLELSRGHGIARIAGRLAHRSGGLISGAGRFVSNVHDSSKTESNTIAERRYTFCEHALVDALELVLDVDFRCWFSKAITGSLAMLALPTSRHLKRFARMLICRSIDRTQKPRT